MLPLPGVGTHAVHYSFGYTSLISIGLSLCEITVLINNIGVYMAKFPQGWHFTKMKHGFFSKFIYIGLTVPRCQNVQFSIGHHAFSNNSEKS